MSDFDYWSRSALDVLVTALKACGAEVPSYKAITFWHNVFTECLEADESGEVENTDAAALAQDVASEYETVARVTVAEEGILVSDLSCAESRLLSVSKGIKGVLYIASHSMEPLWAADGVKYHTICLSPAVEASKTLSSQLPAALRFLKSHKPALICSSCPTQRALVLAAFTHREASASLPIRDAVSAAEKLLQINHGAVGAEDLAELESYALCLVPPPPPSRLPPPQLASPIASPIESSDDGSLTDRTAPELTTPRLKPKITGPTASDDSSATQVDALLIDVGTPQKVRGADDERAFYSKKRQRDSEELGTPLTARVKLKGDDATTIDMTPGTESPPATPRLSRGDCTRCSQPDVLGWPHNTEMMWCFECCACHDTHDEDDAVGTGLAVLVCS